MSWKIIRYPFSAFIKADGTMHYDRSGYETLGLCESLEDARIHAQRFVAPGYVVTVRETE